MDNKIDNLTLTALKVLGIGVALASIFAANAAHADYRPYSYLETYGYDAELQDCVELLRPTLGATAYEKTSYVVEEISLRGPWFRFEIAASVIGRDGGTRIDGFKVLCKSNRWIESARLIARKNAPSVDRGLVVKNSSELITYNLVAANTARN